MKKLLLLGASALCVAGATALIQPVMLDDFQALQVSREGTWIAGDLFGTVKIYNTQTGKTITFEGDGMAVNYSVGMGNAFTLDGSKLVGEALFTDFNEETYESTTTGGPAVYMNGEWVGLKVVNDRFTNMANAISGDGLRICGSIGMAPISLEETKVPMLVPAVWELQSDGTYGDPIQLPYPATDWTGTCPQYVTAMQISRDGKTIVGQVVDDRGLMVTPILYTLGDDGKWTYTQPFNKEMTNPNEIVIPPYPGDAPAAPNIEDFLDPESKAAYEAAMEQWRLDNEEAGSVDYSTMPNIEDYITEEAAESYQAAMDAYYDGPFAEWSEKYDAWDNAYWECVAAGVICDFNNIYLTADGKTIVCTHFKEVEDPDPNSWRGTIEKSGPLMINLASNKMTPYPVDSNASVSGVAYDGTILAGVVSDDAPEQAVIFLPGTEQPITLVDYLETRNAETCAWVKENMFHDMEYIDWVWEENEEDEEGGSWVPVEGVNENVNCTGYPFCTPDLSMIITHIGNYWDYETESSAFSYVLPIHEFSGVKPVSMIDDVKVVTLKGGIVLIEGECSNVSVYDAEGRVIYAGVPANGKIETGLGAGVYFVKAESPNGTKIVKATF